MSLDRIQLSQGARDQLVRLKTHTGLRQWNELCRWAFCVSLSEPGIPAPSKIPADSNVEMSWRVFGGAYADVYLALLKQRCHQDGFELDDETLDDQFRLHLHRGIGYLFGDKERRSISGLIGRALAESS